MIRSTEGGVPVVTSTVGSTVVHLSLHTAGTARAAVVVVFLSITDCVPVL